MVVGALGALEADFDITLQSPEIHVKLTPTGQGLAAASPRLPVNVGHDGHGISIGRVNLDVSHRGRELEVTAFGATTRFQHREDDLRLAIVTLFRTVAPDLDLETALTA